jgi:hypothetical protein
MPGLWAGLCNEVFAVAKAARSALESIAKRVEKLEVRLGASSGPGSLGKSAPQEVVGMRRTSVAVILAIMSGLALADDAGTAHPALGQ